MKSYVNNKTLTARILHSEPPPFSFKARALPLLMPRPPLPRWLMGTEVILDLDSVSVFIHSKLGFHLAEI